MTLLGLQPGHDTDDLGILRDRVFVVERAARLLVVVPLQIHAVVDQADGHALATLVTDLLLDCPGHDNQPIHQRRQLAQCLAVVDAADAARMNRRDHGRPLAAFLTQQQGGKGPYHLGAVHVVVDNLRLDWREQFGQRLGSGSIVRLVDHVDLDACLLQASNAAAV